MALPVGQAPQETKQKLHELWATSFRFRDLVASFPADPRPRFTHRKSSQGGVRFRFLPVVPDNPLDVRIAAAKARLGKDVVVLGHHFQRDEVLKFADFRGDSLKLSFQAAETYSRYIVFCGVHFMAESADILRREHQIVVLADLNAGCSMAHMAEFRASRSLRSELASVVSGWRVVPVNYMNTTAAILKLSLANAAARFAPVPTPLRF